MTLIILNQYKHLTESSILDIIRTINAVGKNLVVFNWSMLLELKMNVYIYLIYK